MNCTKIILCGLMMGAFSGAVLNANCPDPKLLAGTTSEAQKAHATLCKENGALLVLLEMQRTPHALDYVGGLMILIGSAILIAEVTR